MIAVNSNQVVIFSAETKFRATVGQLLDEIRWLETQARNTPDKAAAAQYRAQVAERIEQIILDSPSGEPLPREFCEE